jgi:hypothetical protein
MAPAWQRQSLAWAEEKRAVTGHCDGCITVHTSEALRHNGSRGEIAETQWLPLRSTPERHRLSE